MSGDNAYVPYTEDLPPLGCIIASPKIGTDATRINDYPVQTSGTAPMPVPLVGGPIQIGPYVTKDSGLGRREFGTGSVRDVRAGKGRYDLIPTLVLRRWAGLYERGAEKYDPRNWEKGQPLMSYIDSGMRHLLGVADGLEDEDHAAAVLWNIGGYMWTKEMIKRGVLPAELDDRPRYGPDKKLMAEVLNDD